MINFKNIRNDIRFWIFLFFILRLFSITDPPLEVAHNWRQTTVTMAARNFFEVDPNILFPRIDIAGEKTGITGMEFPLLNFLIYLVSLVFGYAHWYGRLINLVVSSFGLFYFYKLIFKYFDAKLAFNATIILLFSVWFNYSRKIMPDTFSMSLVLAGVYYGTNFLDKERSFKNIFLFFVAVLAGILSKLPSGYLLVIFIFPLYDKKVEMRPKIIFSFLALVVSSLVAFYYFYWVPYLVAEYECNHFFMGKGFVQGIKETVIHFPEVAEKFYEEALQYIGFATFLIGIFFAFKNRNTKLGLTVATLFVAFLLVIFKAGSVFYHHAYYIVPFAPAMALAAAYGVQQLPGKKTASILLILIAAENIANRFSDYHVNPDKAAMVNLEKDLDQLSSRKDLILINSKNVPTPMYFSHHKGWINFNSAISNPVYIDSLKQKGLKYIVILKRTFGENLDLPYTNLFENEDYKIYNPR